MTRLFLAAGVAALAIASPATAKPGGGRGGGGGGGNPNGGAGGPQVQQQGGGGRGFAAPEIRQRGGGRGGSFAVPQMQRFAVPRERGRDGQGFQFPRQERQQFRVERQAQNRGFERQQMRVQREAQNRSSEQQQMRMQREAQNRGFERQQMRANREFRQQLRGSPLQGAQNRGFDRQQARARPMQQFQHQQAFAEQQLFAPSPKFRGDGRRFVREQQQAYQQALSGTSFAPLYYGTAAQVLAPSIVQNFIGVPVQAVANYATLAPLPRSIEYLYPATRDYYYQYGDGYAYQINRGSNLIEALIPLLAGGYLPGQYLPQPYMASYVPAYYGFNSFYPDYGDTCNRYANGVVYEVDCYSGMVEDVIPLYAGGYGVGQMLPASYAYYNVPSQYRNLYYDTPDYNYWYAPGAIYQYDPRSSMITSVAALLSPGFSVGQPLPVGYDVYNVPYDYRATYYDTPSAWYRYSNGYIYQVDPVTRLVSAIVASVLT